MAAGQALIVVDTSVWAAFFNGDQSPPALELDRLLATGASIAILPIILMEVLQGFRTEEGFDQAERSLTRLPVLTPSLEIHVLAARLYRYLRRRGVTVRGTVDCLIAVSCLEARLPLLTLDRDFAFIARHVRLRLHPAGVSPRG